MAGSYNCHSNCEFTEDGKGVTTIENELYCHPGIHAVEAMTWIQADFQQ